MDYLLGAYSEISPNGAKQYNVDIDGVSLDIFVVHHEGDFFAYENRCPHVGVNLNWQPDQFLNIDQTHIQCSTHGAQFNIDNGLCVWGPCIGQSLNRLGLKLEGGNIILQIKT